MKNFYVRCLVVVLVCTLIMVWMVTTAVDKASRDYQHQRKSGIAFAKEFKTEMVLSKKGEYYHLSIKDLNQIPRGYTPVEVYKP